MEISNLSDAGFKTLVIRMLKELSEDLSSMKKIQSEMKDTLIEIKNNLQGNNSRVDEARNKIKDLEHKENINIQPEQNEETRIQKKKNEESIRRLWDISKYANIRIIRGARRIRGRARN